MIAESGDGMGVAGRLELSGVGISLHGRVLVPPLSLAIDGGRVAVLMGPSGSGKSSLLAHLCGTLDPVFDTVGRATLGGVDLEGLPPERLAAAGFGEYRPLDSRDDDIAYRRNRRIEFKLTEG